MTDTTQSTTCCSGCQCSANECKCGPQVQLHSNVQLRTHMYFQRSLRLHEKE